MITLFAVVVPSIARSHSLQLSRVVAWCTTLGNSQIPRVGHPDLVCQFLDSKLQGERNFWRQNMAISIWITVGNSTKITLLGMGRKSKSCRICLQMRLRKWKHYCSIPASSESVRCKRLRLSLRGVYQKSGIRTSAAITLWTMTIGNSSKWLNEWKTIGQKSGISADRTLNYLNSVARRRSRRRRLTRLIKT